MNGMRLSCQKVTEEVPDKASRFTLYTRGRDNDK